MNALHFIMFSFFPGAGAVGAATFKAAWARNCNAVISEGQPR